MQENMTIEFNAKIKPIKPINSELTLCKCYVLALGKNRNKSNILEAAVTDALPTLFNIPVVGHIFVDHDGKYHMGGHDVKLSKDENGKYKFQTLTVPYGTVPAQNNIRYEEVDDGNGNKQTYLVADVILWTGRYPELKETIYSNDVYFGQSMEIKAQDIARDKEDKAIINVNKFTFSALCLLGKSDDKNFNYEPCFPSAKLGPYRFSLGGDFKPLFEEFKTELALCFSGEEGGKRKVYENLEDDDKKPKKEGAPPADEVPAAQEPESAAENPLEPEEIDGGTFTFAATYEVKRNAISTTLRGMSQTGKESVTEYSLVDFDEKFVFVERLYATKLESKYTKGRMTYEMKEDLTAMVNASSFETMLLKWLTSDEAAALDKEREEHAALVAYKAENMAAERKRKYTSVVEEFPDLYEDEEFKTLAGSLLQFSCEDTLREKLFAMRGKKVAPTRQKTGAKIPVGLDAAKVTPYGGFFEKYLK